MTNIEIQLPALAKALRIGASIYASSPIAVLNNMQLAVEKGRAALSFTNADMWLTTSIPATADAITATTIPAALFASAAGAMEGDKLSIEANATRATLKSGRAKLQLPTLPADGFPMPMADEAPEAVAVVQAKEVAAAISAIGYAAPADGIMYPQAVRLDPVGDHIALVTFDGKRMAYDEAKNTGDGEWEPFSLPLKAAVALGKLCAEAKGEVRFHCNGRLATFLCGDWVLRSKLADPRFPNYATVLNERSKTPVSFDPRLMEKALNRLALVADAKAESVDFSLSSDQVTVSLTNARTGDATEGVPAFYDGPDLKMVFRLTFLRDALRNIAGDTAEMHLTPFKDGPGRDLFRAVIEPVNTVESTSIHFFASYAL